MTEHTTQKPPAVILAGGSGERMGNIEKCLLKLGDGTLLSRITTRLEPQVAMLMLNTNSTNSAFDDLSYPQIRDAFKTRLGPLAGIASTMQWLQDNNLKDPWLCVIPGDCPFLPPDLVARLVAKVENGEMDIVYATSNGREHFVVGLWSTALLPKLHEYLAKGERSVGGFLHQQRCIGVDFETRPVDPFYNINTKAEYEEAQRIVNDHLDSM